MNYHQYFIDNISENCKVLDIGCGIGAVSFSIANKARFVVGIDINKNSIIYARKHFQKENIKYIIGDATSYNFDDKFDHIILSNVLEHIENRIEFLNKIKQLGGFFLIRVPMINRSWLTLYKKNLGIEYRLDPSHYIEYTFQSFQEEMDNVGLKILSFSIQFGEIWAKVQSLE